LTQGYFGAEASPYLSLSDFIKRWPDNNPAIPRREVLMITSGIGTVYAGLLVVQDSARTESQSCFQLLRSI
jgi:hypothetical protein